MYKNLSFLPFWCMVAALWLIVFGFLQPSFASDNDDLTSMPDSQIVDISCDVNDDSDCQSKGYNYQNFKIKVEYEPLDGLFGSASGDIQVGHCKTLAGMNFCVEREADEACVYAYTPFQWKVEDKDDQDGDGITTENCMYLPTPISTLSLPSWHHSVSEACTDYTYPYDKGFSAHENPFSSAVVLCIEETLMKLFFDTTEATGLTFFQTVRERLKDILTLLLTLYVIMLGLRVVVSQKIPPKSEMVWFFLRFGLVLFFASGPGLEKLGPLLINSSKDLSVIVMEAGLSNTRTYTTTDETGEVTTITEEVEGFYDYCDFRDETYNTLTINDDLVLSMNHMRLWDMIDCKLAKYLGIGVSGSDKAAPKTLLIMLTAVISNAYGILILIFGIAALLFVLLFAFRIVHIYIMAVVAVIILLYIGPLIIPAVLFNFTKPIYQSWQKQIIAYLLQPVLMFAFLSIAFLALDSVYFGDNKTFDNSGNIVEPCTDDKALGCLIQTVEIKNKTILNFLNWKIFYLGASTSEGKYIFFGLLQLCFICFVLSAISSTIEDISLKIVDGAGGGAHGLSGAPRGIAPQDTLKGIGSGIVNAPKNLKSAKESGSKALKGAKSVASAVRHPINSLLGR